MAISTLTIVTEQLTGMFEQSFAGLFDSQASSITAEEVAGMAAESFGSDALLALIELTSMAQEKLYPGPMIQQMVSLFETAIEVLSV